jgi:hypothetical protein
MNNIVDYPLVVFALSLVALWVAAFVGTFARRKFGPLELKEDERQDFGVVQGAALTLLGLLIGFTFSMAVSRYDQRKNYEEAEANAIGTEYVRAGLLPPADAAKARELLSSYLDKRVVFYTTRNLQQLREINANTAQLQNELWSIVQDRASVDPTAMVALVASGMNDVLNSEGYTQAAWWNRIPVAAWVLMAAIAIGCNVLIGYGIHRSNFLLIVFPLAVSVSFFLIADIDSPRTGVILLRPQNLVSLAQTLNAHSSQPAH